MQRLQQWADQDVAPDHRAPSLEALPSHTALHGHAARHLKIECLSVQVLTLKQWRLIRLQGKPLQARQPSGCRQGCVMKHHIHVQQCGSIPIPAAVIGSHAGTQHGCTDKG